MSKSKIIFIVLVMLALIGLGFFVMNNKTPTAPSMNTDTKVDVPKETLPDISNSPAFSKPVTLHLDDKIIFPDGLVVILTQTNDSRCGKDVQCFWQGEISAVLEVSGGKISEPGEVRLGTETNKTVNVEGYIFTINSTTTADSINITVKYKNVE